MKRILLVAVVVAVVGSFCYLDARSDYRWAEPNIAQKKAEGWTLAASNDNFAEPTRPWTLFRAPVTGLWFVQPAERIAVAPNVFVLPQLSLHFDFDKTEQIEGLVAFDLVNHRSAFIDEGVSAPHVKVSALEWRSFKKDTPGAKVQAFVEAAVAEAPSASPSR